MNTIFVKVSTVGGSVQEVCLESGATVEDALNAAGISAAGKSIKRGTRELDLDDSVSNGDILVIMAASNREKYAAGQ